MKMSFLRKSNGGLLGRVDTDDDGVQWLYDRSGGSLGRFDPRHGLTGQTYDRSGSVVGQGNILTTLLRS